MKVSKQSTVGVQVTVLLLGHAVTNCLDMKEIFDRDTATNVLGRLVEEQELPKLIVRTLINVWHAHTEMQRCAAVPFLNSNLLLIWRLVDCLLAERGAVINMCTTVETLIVVAVGLIFCILCTYWSWAADLEAILECCNNKRCYSTPLGNVGLCHVCMTLRMTSKVAKISAPLASSAQLQGCVVQVPSEDDRHQVGAEALL